MNKFKIVYTDNYVKKKGLASRYDYIFGQTEDSALADADISRVNITGIYAIQPLETPIESLEATDEAPEQTPVDTGVSAVLLVDTPGAVIPAAGTDQAPVEGTVTGPPVNEPASEQPDEPALFDEGQAESAEVPVTDSAEFPEGTEVPAESTEVQASDMGAHDDLSIANAGDSDFGGGGGEQ